LSLDNIKRELDEIDKTILGYSVDKGLSVEELMDVLAALNRLKDRFFEISFMNNELSVLDGIRFYVLENIYNVLIFIKESNGEDTFEELEGLKALETKGLINLERGKN